MARLSDRDEYLEVIAREGYLPRDADRFAATWDSLEEAFLERLFEATVPFGNWRQRFRAAAMETARLVEAHRREARFLSVDALAAGELGRMRRARLGQRLARLLDSARDELDDSVVVPEATAGWVLGIFFDRIYRRCAAGTDPDLPSQVPELLFLAVSAYFGTRAGLEELARPLR